MKKILPFLIALVVSPVASAQSLVPKYTYILNVSAKSEALLNQIGEQMRINGTEISISCQSGKCALEIDPSPEAQMDVDLIEHPFSAMIGKPQPMVLRLYGGTQNTLGTLYKTLGNYAPTNDFRGEDERKLRLEEEGVKFRCTATREEAPVYHCWTLFHAKILELQEQQ